MVKKIGTSIICFILGALLTGSIWLSVEVDQAFIAITVTETIFVVMVCINFLIDNWDK
jgi:hypothetical protein